MLKKNLKSIVLSSLLILLPTVVGIILWNRLPQEVPMHWNISGEIDAYGSKTSLVFFSPLFLLAVHIICIVATFLDPKNKTQNKKIYKTVFFVTPLIANLLIGFIYAVSLGYSVRVECALMLIFAIMFFILGNYLPKCKKNYTIGIKVAWALDDEDNWNATHRFTGKLWTISSVLFIVPMFTPKSYSTILFLILVLIITIIPVIYSYLFYKNKNKKDQ